MIKQLFITEKTSMLNEFNCYTFLVDNSTNKIELKKYITEYFNTKIIKINILKQQPKKIRRGKVTGTSKTFKKAYVYTVDKIDSLEETK